MGTDEYVAVFKMKTARTPQCKRKVGACLWKEDGSVLVRECMNGDWEIPIGDG